MKIVIISRTIYPRLSPRSFRATELAKEFARLGHDVTLYGVLGSYDYTEFTAKTGVTVKPIKMLLSTYNSEGKQRYNFFDKAARHLFNKLIEYPDIEFCWKIPQIIKQEHDTDLLITIAMPFPIHWGAAIAKHKLKEKFPKVWISDCGDPYMGNGMEGGHLSYFKYVEQFWGDKTDYVTIPIESARTAYYPKIQNKIRIIPQGFDMENIKLSDYSPNPVPHFAYAGAIYIGKRDPSSFLEYLCSLNTNFVFTVFTETPDFYLRFKQILGPKLIIRRYIPRNELLLELSKQDFLINLLNQTTVQSPSKLIDYLLTRRPIINISTPFQEKEKFEKALSSVPESDIKDIDISEYDIRNIAHKFLSTANSHLR